MGSVTAGGRLGHRGRPAAHAGGTDRLTVNTINTVAGCKNAGSAGACAGAVHRIYPPASRCTMPSIKAVAGDVADRHKNAVCGNRAGLSGDDVANVHGLGSIVVTQDFLHHGTVTMVIFGFC